MSKLKIQFLGATETVTGSKYLISIEDKKILVDCGLFQGLKSLRLKNWETFPVNPATISAVILTHAHIDHSGYIPKLIKDGFRGKIYSTAATKDTSQILLPDCGYLLEEEAEYLNHIGKSKHKPALPLFTRKEAELSLQYFESVPFKQVKKISEELSFEFHYVGHILGAASVILNINGYKLAFTGDVGRLNDRIFFPPEPLPAADFLVTESTYGNRLHSDSDPLEDLAKVVNDTYDRGGVIIIPAFAVGRAQSLMFYLSQLKKSNRIPNMPMYLNSPMATHFGEVFRKYPELHKLTVSECEDMNTFVKCVNSAEESKQLNQRSESMIIIAASGMLSGGRVLHHLKTFAPYSKNTILLSGYQSAGTRGESLLMGAKELKIHGEYVQVRAHVKALDNMSAHADYREMVQWFKNSKINPRKVFVTHGEVSASDEFRRRLYENFNWNCTVPKQNEEFLIN